LRRSAFERDPREEGGTPLTTELARIDDELRRADDGECWHGPPLREILRGVLAATAAARHSVAAQPLSVLRGQPGRLDASSAG
jgi:hypothetical protein